MASQTDISLPAPLRRILDKELYPSERIRWIGQPVPQFWTAASITSVIFAIPWTSFSIFWMWGALGFRFPDLSNGFQPQYLFALFGVPFVLIGVGMLSSPWWVRHEAHHTVYLITDQRVILIQGAWSTTVRSYFPDQLNDLYRKEHSNGTGDVILGVRRRKDSDGDMWTEEIGFLGVQHPQAVERSLRQWLRNEG